MGIKSKIEWCDSTCNPEIGCNGCELWRSLEILPDDEVDPDTPAPGDGTCYAADIVARWGRKSTGYPTRFDRPELYPYRLLQACGWPDLTGTERPEKPWLDGYPRAIFLNDLGDTYTERLDDPAYVRALAGAAESEADAATKRLVPGATTPPRLSYWNVVALAAAADAVKAAGHWLDPFVPQMAEAPHIWILLTKRPRRMRQAFERLGGVPRNFWLMTSVTSPRSIGRVRELVKIKGASVLGVSVEPVFAEIDLEPFRERLSWVIVGGESGPRAGETRLGDIESALRVCSSVKPPLPRPAPFLKQLGAHPAIAGPGGKLRLDLDDPKGGNPREWPPGLQDLRKMPDWPPRNSREDAAGSPRAAFATDRAT